MSVSVGWRCFVFHLVNGNGSEWMWPELFKKKEASIVLLQVWKVAKTYAETYAVEVIETYSAEVAETFTGELVETFPKIYFVEVVKTCFG